MDFLKTEIIGFDKNLAVVLRCDMQQCVMNVALTPICEQHQETLGVIQVLRNAVGRGCRLSRKKALQRCKVQCYYSYERVGGDQISWKKALRIT